MGPTVNIFFLIELTKL